MRDARRVRRSAALLAAILLAAPSAGAQSPTAPAGATPPAQRVVDVTILGGGDGAATLMDTVHELLGRLGLDVTPHLSPTLPSENPPPSAAVASGGISVWIDLGSRYEAHATVKSASGEVRRVVPRDGSPAVVREEIAEAVRSSVEALLMAEQVPRPAAPPVVVPPEPPPSVAVAAPPAVAPPDASAASGSSRWFALDVTTFAGGSPVSGDSGIVPRVGGGVVLASRHGRRPSLTVTGAYLVPFANPFDMAGTTVTAHATLVSVRALPAVELLHWAWGALDVGAGGGFDVVTVDATLPGMTTTVKTEPSQTRVDPVLMAAATAYASLTPGVALTLVAGAEWDLTPGEYFVQGGGDVFVPWRVRPVVLAGFTFTAVGNGLFATRDR
jgi:hypothetical protein